MKPNQSKAKEKEQFICPSCGTDLEALRLIAISQMTEEIREWMIEDSGYEDDKVKRFDKKFGVKK
jgi:hypothetical protein